MRARTGLFIVLGLVVGAGLLARLTTDSPSGNLPRFEAQPSTSRDDLLRTATAARSRLAQSPADTAAAVSLADVLLRLARVESDAGHAIEAERILKQALRHDAGEYTALKMLGAVYLSQHRFQDAVSAAERARAARPKDAWNYGVLGDAYLELGDYDRAFDAFDTMARVRPDAAAYARVAYAHELQGRLQEALATMQMAAEATSAHDPESLAWHHAQLGHLHLELGDIEAAQRAYARANFIFPDHPYARTGLARVALARKEYDRALETYRALMQEAPTPELAAIVGDLLAVRGDADGAQAMYAEAETLEREGWKAEEPQPAALARLLAERHLKPAEAVALAERAAAVRSDIFTMDAAALAYFRAGRLSEAAAAAANALRTGTRNRQILLHAAEIADARGNHAEARRLLARMPEGPVVEPLIARTFARLAETLGDAALKGRRYDQRVAIE